MLVISRKLLGMRERRRIRVRHRGETLWIHTYKADNGDIKFAFEGGKEFEVHREEILDKDSLGG